MPLAIAGLAGGWICAGALVAALVNPGRLVTRDPDGRIIEPSWAGRAMVVVAWPFFLLVWALGFLWG